VHCASRVDQIELGTISVVDSEKAADAKRSNIPIEIECVHIGSNTLCKDVSRDGVSVERFVLGSFRLSAINDRSAIRSDSGYDSTCVAVERERAAVGVFFKHFRENKLLGTLNK
jgi:hypothetical protein